MSDLIRPIRQTTHGDKYWLPAENYKFALGALVAPVAAGELSNIATQMPMAFLAADGYRPSALMGFKAGENLFISEAGQWVGTYVPAIFRAHPFRLITVEEGQYALAFDEGSGLLRDSPDGAEPFFVGGQPSERVQKSLNFLVQLNSGLKSAAAVGQVLEELDLLEQWPLKVKTDDREAVVDGLYTVNETRMLSLPSEDFEQLKRSGALPFIYAQLISMVNVSTLSKLVNVRQQVRDMNGAADISSLLHEGESDEQIDWDAVLKSN